MLGRLEKSIVIGVAPEKVWKMLALDRQVEWSFYGWKNVEYTSKIHTSEDKYRIGTSAHIIEEHEEFDYEITESIRNERLTGRQFNFSKSGNVTMTVTYILKPLEEGTRITAVVEYEMPNIILRMIARLSKRQGEKAFEKSLKKLRSILEQDANRQIIDDQ